MGWDLYFLLLLRFFFLIFCFTTLLLSLEAIFVFNFLWRGKTKKKKSQTRSWKVLISCEPYLHQDLENMPSQCSLTWWCDCRGWVVAWLVISQSSSVGKENALSGTRFKSRGGEEGVETVVGRGIITFISHFTTTTSSRHRWNRIVERWSLTW